MHHARRSEQECSKLNISTAVHGIATAPETLGRGGRDSRAHARSLCAHQPRVAAMVEPHRANASDPRPALESQHCRAICTEIGERLQQSLKPQDASPMPPHLSRLVNRLSSLDGPDGLRRGVLQADSRRLGANGRRTDADQRWSRPG